jgi:hypothetical protein
MEADESNLFKAPNIAGVESPIESLYNRKERHVGPVELLDKNPEN